MTIKTLVEVAKGVIEAASFPVSIQVDVWKDWSATVHNIGATGYLGLGIVNGAGNPGSIVVKSGGKETTIAPNQYLRWYYTDPVSNCTLLTISDGEVKFLGVGTYTIKIWAMHREGETWIYDDEKIFTVVVEEEVVEPTLWEKLKEFVEENPLAVAVGLGSVIGGAVIYQKKSKG